MSTDQTCFCGTRPQHLSCYSARSRNSCAGEIVRDANNPDAQTSLSPPKPAVLARLRAGRKLGARPPPTPPKLVKFWVSARSILPFDWALFCVEVKRNCLTFSVWSNFFDGPFRWSCGPAGGLVFGPSRLCRVDPWQGLCAATAFRPSPLRMGGAAMWAGPSLCRQRTRGSCPRPPCPWLGPSTPPASPALRTPPRRTPRAPPAGAVPPPCLISGPSPVCPDRLGWGWGQGGWRF